MRGLAATTITALAIAPLLAFAADRAAIDTTINVNGLRAPAEIRIDRWGVPHLQAASESDLFFVQGFNAARDRLFQIDLWRRRGLGQLAEVLGPDFVAQDRAARLFLYRGDMAREWRNYDAAGTVRAKAAATRFAAGINAYIDTLGSDASRLPWEFRALGYAPARWSADDVVRIRSHGLTQNLVSEVARARVLCATGDVDVDRIRQGLSDGWKAIVPEGLDPCLPADVLKTFLLATQPVAITHLPDGVVGIARADVEAQVDGRGSEGSNSWVIAREHSTTGRAILANDPHRAYSVPSLRYLVHLTAPGIDAIGAGEPALPGLSLGHNGHVAFGLTIFSFDQEDLYVYALNPANPRQYRYGDGWEDMRVVRERVAVRGEPARDVELVFTRHGPVIHTDEAGARAYAVRTVWLEPGTSPYFGSLAYMNAPTIAAFEAALAHSGAPPLNQVFADRAGNIGWKPAGLAPRRPNWDGLLPVPGDGRYEWSGFWSARDFPSVFNPRAGFIATANAYNLPEGFPARERRFAFEWTNPARQQRLDEVLSASPKISLADSMRLQNDLVSPVARRLTALARGLPSSDPKVASAQALFAEWNGEVRADSAAAALEELWLLRHLRRGFRNAIAGEAAAAALGTTDVDVMLAALERPEFWFGDDARAKRDALLATTLAGAWTEMESLQGSDPQAWQWGRLHFHRAEHPLSAAVSAEQRARIDVGPYPKAGSEFSPSQSPPRETDFRQLFGPAVRLVIDVGAWDNSVAVNHPGQAGDPDDAHYRDLVPLWRAGEYFPLVYSRAAVRAATERVIRLRPASPLTKGLTRAPG